MNLQQLRYVAEVAQRNLNVSDAARALHTSQSGVSRQISLLEEELGLDIFVRHGKRLVAITRPGEEVIAGLGIQGVSDGFWFNLGMVVALQFLFRIAAYALLRYKRRI